jgi:hypothetical protein
MGDWGAVCAILISAWVTSWGAQLGDRGGGGGSVMVILLDFFYVASFSFEKRGQGGGKNKLGPKKVQCDLEHRPSQG